jgi:hypothetical protein
MRIQISEGMISDVELVQSEGRVDVVKALQCGGCHPLYNDFDELVVVRPSDHKVKLRDGGLGLYLDPICANELLKFSAKLAVLYFACRFKH